MISSLLSIPDVTAASILQALNRHGALPHPINEEGLGKMAMFSLSAAELRSFIGSSSTTMAAKTHMIAHLATHYHSHAAATDAFLNNTSNLAPTADGLVRTHFQSGTSQDRDTAGNGEGARPEVSWMIS